MKKTFDATVRSIVGKGASRRLRHADLVPAVIYGPGHDPINVEIRHDDLFHAQEDQAFFTDVLAIKFGGESVEVRVQDIQRHVFKPKIVHIDFKRA
jgi:large subunit ribosomal protein L25